MMTTRIGNYQIVNELGFGSMAVVYRAKHMQTGQPVALKVMNRSLCGSESYRIRFSHEAGAMSELRHPNIVSLVDYIDDGSNLAIVMELIEGRTLDYMIEKETGPVPWERAMGMFNQMLAALDYAHTRKIIHRDIKPLNIMVTCDDTVKIMDMGVALKQGNMRLTRVGSMMGTLYYNAPEVVKGGDHTIGSDIYALGMTFYEMLTGNMPLEKKSSSELNLRNAIVHDDLPDPRDYYPHIPQWIVEIIRKSLAKDPERRYSSCCELRSDMMRGLSEPAAETISVREFDEVHSETDRWEYEPPRKAYQDRSVIFALLGSALLFVILFLIFGGTR